MRRTLVSTLATVGALVRCRSPASAGTLTTQNSCQWSYDTCWRHLDVDLAGVASPNPVAPAPASTLTQTSVHVRIPDYLTEDGHGFQILKAGDNEIRAKAWVAIEGAGHAAGRAGPPARDGRPHDDHRGRERRLRLVHAG